MSKYKRAFVEKLKAEGWDLDSGDHVVIPALGPAPGATASNADRKGGAPERPALGVPKAP